MSYLLIQGDARRLPLANQSVDLVLGSPPYADARTYGIGAQRNCLAWVEWMLDVTAEAHRVSRGPVIWVAAGVTRDRNYWPACEGLMWEWWKRSVGSGIYQDGIELPGTAGSLYRPCYWYRVGIPGSGGKDWFRADVEYAMCFKRPGPLPWSDNTAMGHPPKWAPGGEMSHRIKNGERRNKWGGTSTSSGMRRSNGTRRRPMLEDGEIATRTHTKREPDGTMREQSYAPPVKANPGTLIKVKVGGGLMGHPLAHENEAPYPEGTAEFFVKSLCPPDGTILDPFSGSGTTVSVADRLGRRGIGLDIRQTQAEIARRRIERPHQAAKKPRKPTESLPLFRS